MPDMSETIKKDAFLYLVLSYSSIWHELQYKHVEKYRPQNSGRKSVPGFCFIVFLFLDERENQKSKIVPGV